MSIIEIHNRLETIFQEVFDDDGLHIFLETTVAEIEDWDWMRQVNLIVSCETQFQIRFALSEVFAPQNAGELESLIEVKLAQKANG